jgi:predicted amidophosphoribosyltransferase
MSLMTELRYAVGAFADRATDFAMPTTCAGCYRAGTTLCAECRAVLQATLTRGPGVNAGTAAAIPAPLLWLEWCGPFVGITRRALERLADGGDRRLSDPLGEALAKVWTRAGTGGDVLVPVPASVASTRARGYDEAVLLARVAGRRLRMPVVEALGRTATAAPDRGGEFEVTAADKIRGRSVVLVDDVVATGATLVACAAALMRAGATAVSAVTVARDQTRMFGVVTAN